MGKKYTHRVDVRNSKRGRVWWSIPICEDEIEKYKEKFKHYPFMKIVKTKKI